MADEATGILFVDTALLKSLVTAAIVFTETDLDTIAAVGAIRARGIDSFRQVWDPALLAQSPLSVYGGSEPSTDASIAMFHLLLASECANLKARQGG